MPIKPTEVTIEDDGAKERRRYVFENGWGASVIRGPYSYGGPEGMWELAVMHGPPTHEDCHACYESPVTDDVVGWQTEEDIQLLLEQIVVLPYVDWRTCPSVTILEDALASLRDASERMRQGLSPFPWTADHE